MNQEIQKEDYVSKELKKFFRDAKVRDGEDKNNYLFCKSGHQEEKELSEKKHKEIEEKARLEKERLEELLKNQIECPFCKKTFQLKK